MNRLCHPSISPGTSSTTWARRSTTAAGSARPTQGWLRSATNPIGSFSSPSHSGESQNSVSSWSQSQTKKLGTVLLPVLTWRLYKTLLSGKILNKGGLEVFWLVGRSYCMLTRGRAWCKRWGAQNISGGEVERKRKVCPKQTNTKQDWQ